MEDINHNIDQVIAQVKVQMKENKQTAGADIFDTNGNPSQ